MNKVYVVTSGEYSDYHIEKIFSDRESARLYAMMDADREVEEYEVDSIGIDNTMRYILVKYDYKYNDIRELTLCNHPEIPHIEDDWYEYFQYTLDLSNSRLYASIMRYGKRSGMIKKITDDKFTQYLYEHGTSREELIRKHDEKHAPTGYYQMYTTTAHTDAVSNYFTEYLNKRVAEGLPLPSLPELQCMVDNARKDMESDGN